MKTLSLTAVFLSAVALAAGCGVLIDYARDNELRWGFLGSPDFISPARLRVGVLPFSDEVGLGAPGAGANLARLLSEELAKNSALEVVPPEDMAVALQSLLLPENPEAPETAAPARPSPAGPPALTPALAAGLGSALRLNAVVMGSVSEITRYSQRKGWRRAARFFTSQRDYVDAVLAVSAVDAATGIVLAARANVGEYDGGPGDKAFFENENLTEGPGQEAMEGSLDAALAEAAHRTLTGLAELPFKARVASAGGGEAVIAFGADVGLETGREFVRLELLRTVTNTIGETYQVMGAAAARLKVTEVGDASARLEVTEGRVEPGDVIQAVN